MNKNIKCAMEEIDINESGEVYAKIKPIGYPKSFIVFFPDGEERYKKKKGDLLLIELRSLMPLKKSKFKIKKIIVGTNQNHLVDYIGKIVGIDGNNFLVDATLPIIVDKEPNFKIGDYVTGGFPHDIQAHLVNEEKNEK